MLLSASFLQSKGSLELTESQSADAEPPPPPKPDLSRYTGLRTHLSLATNEGECGRSEIAVEMARAGGGSCVVSEKTKQAVLGPLCGQRDGVLLSGGCDKAVHVPPASGQTRKRPRVSVLTHCRFWAGLSLVFVSANSCMFLGLPFCAVPILSPLYFKQL